MRKIVYYVATSLDGFICGADGDVSRFAYVGGAVDQYLEDLKSYDTVILIGIWNVHFACGDKMNQIEAQNAAGVVPPASICNEDMVHFSSMEVDNSISEQYIYTLIFNLTLAFLM